ncbi:MAG: hypothetical protein WC076_05120 [Terrimicrobiaceae bacterium]
MKTSRIPFHRTGSKPEAFSLVEVVLALGIFTFAVVSLLGLVPLAVSSARSSLDMATAVQLADGLASKFSQDEFSSLPVQPINCFFDELGKAVTDEADATYSASIHFTNNSASSNLKSVKITVTQGKSPIGSKTFCYLLFNQGT